MAVHLYNHCDPREFDVRLGLLRATGPYLDQIDRARVEESPLRHFRAGQVDGPNQAQLSRRNVMALSALVPFAVHALLRRVRPDVVITFLKGMSVCMMFVAPLYGRRRFHWIAREGNNTQRVLDFETRNAAFHGVLKRLTHRAFASADRLVAISEDLGSSLARLEQVSPSKLRTIHNAVDVGEVRRQAEQGASPFPKGERFIAAVGRLEYQKGMDILLEAYARSGTRRTHRLLILGQGSERDNLEQQARRLGIASRLTLHPFSKEPWSVCSTADLFVLPSRWEGFGNVVVEAMAAGIPPVVTSCDFGPREIVTDGKNGLIVPVEDKAALGQALDRLANDASTRARFAAAARERAEDFDVPLVVERYCALFRELVD